MTSRWAIGGAMIAALASAGASCGHRDGQPPGKGSSMPATIVSTRRLTLPPRPNPDDDAHVAAQATIGLGAGAGAGGGAVVAVQLDDGGPGVVAAFAVAGAPDPAPVPGHLAPRLPGLVWRARAEGGVELAPVGGGTAAVIADAPGMLVEQYVAAATARGVAWSRADQGATVALLDGAQVRWSTPLGAAGDGATVAAMAPIGDDALAVALAGRAPGDGALAALDLATGAVRWRVALRGAPLGIAVGDDRAELAALVLFDAPDCEACTRLDVIGARDGATRASARGGVRPDGALRQTAHLGFGRGEIWQQVWMPPHQSGLSGKDTQRCSLDVYDAHATGGPALVRSSNECTLRALLPLADGSVVAFRYGGGAEASLVHTDRAP